LASIDGHSSGSETPRVLLAEDDRATRLILQCWLQENGFDFVVATNGDEAWKILVQKHPPQLVLVDWSMPGIDGIELCRRLRAAERDYYPYVVMITAKDNKQDIAHALESGADDYLVKPFSKADLSARLGVANRIFKLQAGLIRAREELRIQATRDSLTGILNRGTLLDLFARELNRARRSRTSTGFLLLDLDNFKSINDTHGHLAGDQVLQEAARRITQSVRSYDLVGRYGGEEFCIVLPDCPESQLRERAEAIRLAVAQELIVAGCGAIPITTSIGAISATGEAGSISEIIAIADVALYKAKSGGKNCTVVYQSSGSGLLGSFESTAAKPNPLRGIA